VPDSIMRPTRRDALVSGETMSPGQTNLPNQQMAEIIGGTSSISGMILNVEVARRDRTTELGLVLAPTEQISRSSAFKGSVTASGSK
jgi:hypothetical protein